MTLYYAALLGAGTVGGGEQGQLLEDVDHGVDLLPLGSRGPHHLLGGGGQHVLHGGGLVLDRGKRFRNYSKIDARVS